MGEPRDEGSELPEELRALGRLMNGPDGAGETMAERVLAQIIAEHVPAPVAEPSGARERTRRVRAWFGRRWRLLTAALCGVASVVVLTPPVRAAVYDWFGFGGVEIHYDPSASPSPGRPVPGCGSPLTMDDAARAAGFRPLVPAALGSPDAVSVTPEPGGRTLLSLCWRGGEGTIRLDEFPAQLDIGYAKTITSQPEWVAVNHDTGLWFAREHELSFWMFDGEGRRWHRSERPAGPTLLWTHGAKVTLRLEGVTSEKKALDIARSTNDRG
ncbi:hypothetical protein GTW43_23045 [Streptomyces sp. SID5785]|uniref:hypothetical protein n=1 Tax=Streptomyces sp. SID5785 TaxID=2690309 RepID=UPI00136158A3|nr:hypothetical protein [Streptomyces sp. SID5785]MZD07609.1 hypothetical protein [Streptomyces sp. SID5785]MZD07937.1 hypothetical protein [Streptomyces sp. SID5785]